MSEKRPKQSYTWARSVCICLSAVPLGYFAQILAGWDGFAIACCAWIVGWVTGFTNPEAGSS